MRSSLFAMVLLLVAAGSAQANDEVSLYRVSLDGEIEGRTLGTPVFEVREGNNASMEISHDPPQDGDMRITVRVTPANEPNHDVEVLSTVSFHDGSDWQLVSTPVFVAKLDERASMTIGDEKSVRADVGVIVKHLGKTDQTMAQSQGQCDSAKASALPGTYDPMSSLASLDSPLGGGDCCRVQCGYGGGQLVCCSGCCQNVYQCGVSYCCAP